MKTYKYDVLVVGTGAAGYNAICRIKEGGSSLNAAVITEGILCGTSRNTGSDKQTYYKLGLSGDSPDSVRKMAENLFAGGSVDGDNALCEAALSVRCFMNLCEAGVEFPVNRYGEYIGYKTDHDPFERATSVGPLTSKLMTEALEKRAKRLGAEIFDGLLAVEILTCNNSVCGLLALDVRSGELIAFECPSVILATGGPAGIYADSVFPECHTGSTSLALLAGAKAQNLTEWQYGLASVNPRWNVSGTYMQVLPRFVSIDTDGAEHEFLAEYFDDIYEALSLVFLKGYQWPFDSKKVLSGSSVIDLLVYRECVLRNRRVYLDFTKNPFNLESIDYGKLSDEAYLYLSKAGACFGTPTERLMLMNAPAIDLYAAKGLDITKEYLEIALCAQHHNGGIAVDMWWQTSTAGLFAAGECAGTHGVTRPGGSALNAGQVGSLRAAQYICAHPRISEHTAFETALTSAYALNSEILKKIKSESDNADDLILSARRRMSDSAAAIRNVDDMKKALAEVSVELKSLSDNVHISSESNFYKYYKLKDTLVTQKSVLTAMIDYAENGDGTRGSALYYDSDGDLRDGLEEVFRFSPECGNTRAYVQETSLDGDTFSCVSRPVRDIPNNIDFFENVWRSYRENKNIY